jgi:hypothetical protein
MATSRSLTDGSSPGLWLIGTLPGHFRAFARTTHERRNLRRGVFAPMKHGDDMLWHERVSSSSLLPVEHERARLTHSASLFRIEADSAERNRIGRVNRLLHWDDMVRFQELGMRTYDLGGWYTGSRNEALLRINAF